jgi:hypothetical protein
MFCFMALDLRFLSDAVSRGMHSRCGGRAFGLVPSLFRRGIIRNEALAFARVARSVPPARESQRHGGVRETFLPGQREGCEEAAWLVEVERIRLSGAWHRVEIWLPHAACSHGRSFDHVVVPDPASLSAGPEPAGSRTTPSRRRA